MRTMLTFYWYGIKSNTADERITFYNEKTRKKERWRRN